MSPWRHSMSYLGRLFYCSATLTVKICSSCWDGNLLYFSLYPWICPCFAFEPLSHIGLFSYNTTVEAFYDTLLMLSHCSQLCFWERKRFAICTVYLFSTHSASYFPQMFLLLTFTGSNSSAKPSFIFSYFSIFYEVNFPSPLIVFMTCGNSYIWLFWSSSTRREWLILFMSLQVYVNCIKIHGYIFQAVENIFF